MDPLRSLAAPYRRAFSGLSSGVWRISLVILAHRSGTMVLPFLSLYLTQDVGMTPRGAGAVLALYGLGAAAGAYAGGQLTDRIGSFSTQMASLLAAGVAFLALGQAERTVAVAAMVFVTAAAAESFRPANAAAIAELSSAKTRFRAYALRRLAINLGMTLGPAAGGFLATYDYGWLFVIDGGTCFCAALLLWLFFRGRRPPSSQARLEAPRPEASRTAAKVGSAFADRPFLTLLGLVVLLDTIFFQLLTTYPLTLRDGYGFPERTIGLLFAINTLVIVAFEMVLIDVVSRFRPMRVVAAGTVLLGAGLAMLPFGSGIGYVSFSVLVWTVGEMLTFPLIEGLVGNHAPPEVRGQYMGLFTGTFSLAFVLAPVAGTWIYEGWGPRPLWISCGVAGAVVALAFLRLEGPFARIP